MVQFRKYIWEIIGWIGSVFALLAFSLNSFDIISSQSMMYLGMYSLGCLLMGIYGFSKKAHASWVLNVIFLLMGVIVLIRVYVMQV
ncbi:hypothetical protein OOZ15_19170 [Galbibacter sp. EGI 63066]|uniref:hypothetical protein n=1 Tax=Galbibacter sp. EGI 63066 TaxID=2993559 RepID=UPI002249A0E4|nr:hypothetical protein [Galbibacter sp. EGI 63066]MCX2682079.1 hypothetical protein [Galbibacter sp. EGI 63066]